MTLYDKIKSMADDQNLTISYIEENAQLSNGSISKWKVNSPRADSLYKVAKFLGCSIDYLMSEDNDDDHSNTYKGNLVSENSNQRYYLNENEVEILNILNKFKTYRNQIKFIARVELLSNEMLSSMEDNKQDE